MLGLGSNGPVWLAVEVEVEVWKEAEEVGENGVRGIFCPLGRVKGAVMLALASVLFMVMVLWSVVESMDGVEMTIP